jgi:polyhydroxyalkanoate synthesis repressor PhaR
MQWRPLGRRYGAAAGRNGRIMAELAGTGPTAVIRKYANRRLYDTGASRYVTLAEIARRLRAGECLRVIEARGGADVTRKVLAQIVLEAEAKGGGLFDEAMLERLARFAGHPDRAELVDAIAETLEQFAEEGGGGPRRHAPGRHHGPPRPPAAPSSSVAHAHARIDALQARLRRLIADADRRRR